MMKAIGVFFSMFSKRSGYFPRKIFFGYMRLVSRGIRNRLSLYAYGKWIHLYDTPSVEDRIKINRKIGEFRRRPLFSVVMPVYNPNLAWLQEAIDSVYSQVYPYWELCIADDASDDPRVRDTLERNAQQDKRVKVLYRENNGHISATSNDALSLAMGEFVVLLDHDDVLAGHALYSIADAINRNVDGAVFFSDEDKIDKAGRRYNPYFKCDWNYDLFLSQNMISHLGCYKRSLLHEVGGFRTGYEGSQDYDLALRCMESIRPDQIIHIPRILYHWRAHETSTASTHDSKPYALLAGQKAIGEHLTRKGIKATVELQADLSNYRVRYELPDPVPRVSLIMIMAGHDKEFVVRCAGSILEKTAYPNVEIIIVANTDDVSSLSEGILFFEENNRIRIHVESSKGGWPALCNAAVNAAQGEIIGMISNDLEVINANWLSEMVGVVVQPGVGAVGAKIWSADDRLLHSGMILGVGYIAGSGHRKLRRNDGGYFGRASVIQSVSAVSSDCLVVRKEIYMQSGGFDEINLRERYFDVDLCMRLIEFGYRNVWVPYSELRVHATSRKFQDEKRQKNASTLLDVEYMRKRWGMRLLNDPAYSPNLSLQGKPFSLAWPPRTGSLADQ